MVSAALSVDRFAIAAHDDIDEAVVGKRLEGAVDGREPHGFASVAEPFMDFLRGPEVVEVFQRSGDGYALASLAAGWCLSHGSAPRRRGGAGGGSAAAAVESR